MFLAAGQAVIIFGISGEPADLFPGGLPADIAAGGGHLPVPHGIGLGAERFGDEFLIGLIADLKLFLPALGRAVVVHGKVFESLFFIQSLKDSGGIGGVSQRFMEGLILGKLQGIDDGLEIFPGTAVLPLETENLLDIQVIEGKREGIFYMVKAHVPLKLEKILRTPGTENGVLHGAAPFQKGRNHLIKRPGLAESLHIHMQDFLGMAVEAVVDPGPDLFLKLSAFFPLVVQFDGSDLNDLKGKLLILFFFSSGALVPFQVKNDVIHNQVLLVLRCLLPSLNICGISIQDEGGKYKGRI